MKKLALFLCILFSAQSIFADSLCACDIGQANNAVVCFKVQNSDACVRAVGSFIGKISDASCTVGKTEASCNYQTNLKLTNCRSGEKEEICNNT